MKFTILKKSIVTPEETILEFHKTMTLSYYTQMLIAFGHSKRYTLQACSRWK